MSNIRVMPGKLHIGCVIICDIVYVIQTLLFVKQTNNKQQI